MFEITCSYYKTSYIKNKAQMHFLDAYKVNKKPFKSMYSANE